MREGRKVCLALLDRICKTQDDCVDGKRLGTFYCHEGKCVPVNEIGYDCLTDEDCGNVTTSELKL